jgi:hypothetical protein
MQWVSIATPPLERGRYLVCGPQTSEAPPDFSVATWLDLLKRWAPPVQVVWYALIPPELED